MSQAPDQLSPEQRYSALASEIEREIGKVIVGQTDLVRGVLLCLLSEGHALIEGVPGLGKTMLLRTLADTIDVGFARIQFTPDLMPADVTGTQMLREDEAGRRTFEFSEGPLFANLVLADEINRATPKTQSALLEAMQERAVTVAGKTHELPRPFFVMATQNPIEMEGTYPLPEAQLDRFLMKMLVPSPSADELSQILTRTTGGVDARASSVTSGGDLRQMITMTREVPIADHIVDYASKIVTATHPDNDGAPDLVKRYVRFGSSPRGAQALVLTAKASALLDQRLAVAAEDIEAVVKPALRHRLILSYEAVADEVEPDDVLGAVVDAVGSPAQELEGLG